MAVAVHRTHAAQAWRDFVYVTGGLVVGTIWITVLATLLSLGIGLLVITVGIPILALTLLLWRWGANTERERAALVFGVPLPSAHRPLPDHGFLARWKARITDPATWKDFAYMLLIGPVGIAFGGLLCGAWAVALAAIAAPALSVAAPDGSPLADLDAPLSAAVVAGGLLMIGVALLLGRGLAICGGALAEALLVPGDRAALEARVAAVEATRAAAVESADARLRRIERDLHDGAQHRLAYVAMEVGRAREKMATDPEAADALLAGAHEESKKAMAELRDLARGIHPSVLTDRGLDAAVSALAERCPVPVEISLNLENRPPPAAETAAYYLIAEALTNVAKHSGAQHASVAVSDAEGRLSIVITDDGAGGARRAAGSGLEGLAQRVEALDGTFTVDSPAGGPTSIRAELPCAS